MASSGRGEPGLLFIAVHRVLVMASLAVEHGLYRLAGSVVVMHGLSCSTACEIFPYQGSNQCPLQGTFLTTGPPGKPRQADF